jgi:uncharacterized repeat protein (TIGR01451 family)
MNSIWRRFLCNQLARQAARCSLSAVLVTACSCSAARQQIAGTSTDPFLNDEMAAHVATNPGDEATGKGRAVSPSAAFPNSTVPYPHRQDEFDIGARPPDANSNHRAIPAVATRIPARGPGAIQDNAIQFTAAEERCPEFGDRCPAWGECVVIDESPCASARLYPDEYLCDGGDREYPIHYQADQMLGLDSEDAAVEFRDDLGRRRVKPTNRVCIYSPRFSAVTSVAQSLEDVGGGRPVQAIAATTGLGLSNREGSFAQHQRDATERLVTRIRGSGLTGGAATDAVDRPIAIHGHVHTTTPKLDFAFLRTGFMKQSEEARLAASIQSALVWSRDQNPIITAKSEQAIILKSEFKEQELVGQENRFNFKLRIVKSADKSIAEPGDLVTFSIRYDNLGNREVRDVVIVDNLTPRLEYVEDSATCDVAGVLEVEDNGEGSVILRWVLDEPLPGRSGGVVTFQARVR